jgi:hypothetical protein
MTFDLVTPLPRRYDRIWRTLLWLAGGTVGVALAWAVFSGASAPTATAAPSPRATAETVSASTIGSTTLLLAAFSPTGPTPPAVAQVATTAVRPVVAAAAPVVTEVAPVVAAVAPVARPVVATVAPIVLPVVGIVAVGAKIVSPMAPPVGKLTPGGALTPVVMKVEPSPPAPLVAVLPAIPVRVAGRPPTAVHLSVSGVRSMIVLLPKSAVGPLAPTSSVSFGRRTGTLAGAPIVAVRAGIRSSVPARPQSPLAPTPSLPSPVAPSSSPGSSGQGNGSLFATVPPSGLLVVALVLMGAAIVVTKQPRLLFDPRYASPG